MKKTSILFALAVLMMSCTSTTPNKNEVLSIIDKVNTYWQANNKPETRPFWDNAAYHTGNMEVYFLTKNEDQLAYTKRWAEHNRYWGATNTDKEQSLVPFTRRALVIERSCTTLVTVPEDVLVVTSTGIRQHLFQSGLRLLHSWVSSTSISSVGLSKP